MSMVTAYVNTGGGGDGGASVPRRLRMLVLLWDRGGARKEKQWQRSLCTYH
jgi:hypothetical protein